jgi:hypothetical protein
MANKKATKKATNRNALVLVLGLVPAVIAPGQTEGSGDSYREQKRLALWKRSPSRQESHCVVQNMSSTICIRCTICTVRYGACMHARAQHLCCGCTVSAGSLVHIITSPARVRWTLKTVVRVVSLNCKCSNMQQMYNLPICTICTICRVQNMSSMAEKRASLERR